MNLALIVLLPFLGAVLPPLMIRAGRDTCALVTGGVTAASLALLLTNAPAVFRGEVIRRARSRGCRRSGSISPSSSTATACSSPS